MEFDDISKSVLGAAMAVHSALGPGLFEETYKVCLKYELEQAGMKVLSELPLPVQYRGVKLELGYRIDLLVQDSLIVELKSVQQLQPVHKAQLLTYLKLANKPIGLLLNFNTALLKDGIKRVINQQNPSRPSRHRVTN